MFSNILCVSVQKGSKEHPVKLRQTSKCIMKHLKKNLKSFLLLYRLYRVITCCFQNKYLPKLLSIIHKTNGFIAKLDFPFSKKKWINEANRSRSLSNRYYQAKFHLISRVWIIEIDLISFSDLQNGPFLILRGRSLVALFS